MDVKLKYHEKIKSNEDSSNDFRIVSVRVDIVADLE